MLSLFPLMELSALLPQITSPSFVSISQRTNKLASLFLSKVITQKEENKLQEINFY